MAAFLDDPASLQAARGLVLQLAICPLALTGLAFF